MQPESHNIEFLKNSNLTLQRTEKEKNMTEGINRIQINDKPKSNQSISYIKCKQNKRQILSE